MNAKTRFASALVAAVAVWLALADAYASEGSLQDGWIACNGTSFINTGYFVNPNTKVELDFAMVDPVTNNLQERLLGCDGVSGNPEIPLFEYYIGVNNKGTRLFSWAFWSASGGRLADNCYVVDDSRYTIIMDIPNRTWQVLTNGVEAQTKTYTITPSPYTAKYPLGLFAKCKTTNCVGSVSTYAGGTKMKCYGLKIYESGVLVKNFVPCLKGGRPGMKETISGQFHTGENLSAFTAGGDILTEMDDPYIWTPRNVLKSTGPGVNSFIDTGYYVKPETRVAIDFAMLTPTWSGKVVPWSTTYNPYILCTWGYKSGDSGGTQNFTVYASASNSSSYAGCYYFNVGNGDNKMSLCPIETMYDIRRTFVLDSNSVRVITAGYTNCVAYSSTPLVCNLNTRSLKIGSQSSGTS